MMNGAKLFAPALRAILGLSRFVGSVEQLSRDGMLSRQADPAAFNSCDVSTDGEWPFHRKAGDRGRNTWFSDH